MRVTHVAQTVLSCAFGTSGVGSSLPADVLDLFHKGHLIRIKKLYNYRIKEMRAGKDLLGHLVRSLFPKAHSFCVFSPFRF